MSRKLYPSPCVVCHRATIVPDAVKNHRYGAVWENRCIQCGCNQEEYAWFAKIYRMPGDLLITLQCPFIQHERCSQMHTYPLGALLKHTPSSAQFRCSGCGTYGVGEELLLNNKEVLKELAVSWQRKEGQKTWS